MCRAGDLILIEKSKYKDSDLGKHSFVVITDEGGVIQGLSYDFIGLLLSSFKSEEQKNKKLSYPGNFPIEAKDELMDKTNPNVNINERSGFIKCEQFFLFKKDETEYLKIGTLEESVLQQIMDFIEKMNVEIEIVKDNISQ